MTWLKKVGKVVAWPVVQPAKLVKKGAEKTMWSAIYGVLRHILTAVGGALFVSPGLATQSDLDSAIGAVLVLVGFVLSVIDKKKQAAKKD